jgi:hypothetical protein
LWQPDGLEKRRLRAHIPGMTDTHVIFKAEMISQGDWQLVCHCPGGKIDYVTGFLDEPSTQNWLATEHRTSWLKKRGYLP